MEAKTGPATRQDDDNSKNKRLFTPGFLGEPEWLRATKEGERPAKRFYR